MAKKYEPREVPKPKAPSASESAVKVDFRHNGAKVIIDLMKKYRLSITTRRYNNRHLITLKDSYMVKKWTPGKIYGYCALTGREVSIDVDDIKEIVIIK